MCVSISTECNVLYIFTPEIEVLGPEMTTYVSNQDPFEKNLGRVQ